MKFRGNNDVLKAMIIKNMQPAMYKSLTDMVDDNAGMMDLSQYFRLGKIFHIKLVTTMMR